MMKIRILAFAAVAAFLAVGCSESSHGPDDHDHDVITTVTFTLRPTNTIGETIVAVWEDIDGIGGNNPNRIDTMKLSVGVVYSVSVTVENRSKTPPENLTETISAEKDNHQFIYAIADTLGTVTVMDTDSRGLPVGLLFSLQSASVAPDGLGTFTATLYHYDNATSKVGGVPGSESDASITLPVSVR